MKHLLYFIPLLFLSFIYPDREKLDIKVSQHIEHQTYRAITYNINESFEDPKAFAEEKNVQVALDVDTVQHKVLSMQISYKADATFSEGNLKFIKKAEVGGDIMDSVKLESTFSYLWETKKFLRYLS